MSHAGLILLHPFLTQLFSNLALLTDKKTFVDQDARRKALHVLAWLATGNEEVPEYDLQMPKLLTGWPLHEPISPFIDIDENAQKMSKELLQAVITHWNALGKTTPAGLREGFIQREGRLCLEDRGWRLQVEQRTLDILLGKLPWGLGVVRLPWMDKLLFVDWA